MLLVEYENMGLCLYIYSRLSTIEVIKHLTLNPKNTRKYDCPKNNEVKNKEI